MVEVRRLIGKNLELKDKSGTFDVYKIVDATTVLGRFMDWKGNIAYKEVPVADLLTDEPIQYHHMD